MAKRIRPSRIRKYAELIGGLSIPLVIFLFAYLQNIGAITVNNYSGDMVCAGTPEDPCYAYLNFTANTDIYIYPSPNNSWLFSTDKKLKLLKVERKWGKGWREIKLNESCNGRWCGCYWCDKNHKAKYSYVFRKGRTYLIRFVGYKYNPYSDVKWSFSDKIDPLWKGVKQETFYINDSNNVTIKMYRISFGGVTLETPAFTRCSWNISKEMRDCRQEVKIIYNKPDKITLSRNLFKYKFVKNKMRNMKIKHPAEIKKGNYTIVYEFEYPPNEGEEWDLGVKLGDYEWKIDPEISGCSDITSSGTYYLTANITNSAISKCINIQVNDVILDCQGHTIDGDGSADYGIYIYRSSSQTTNITVKNCVVTNWDSANIYLRLANGNNITNVTVQSGADEGIYLSNSHSNIIFDCSVDSNTRNGFYLNPSSSNKISNCSISSNGFVGIRLKYVSNDNIIANSTIFDNTYGLFFDEIGSTLPNHNNIYNCLFNNTNNIFSEANDVSVENYFNTTKQLGTRIYSDGNYIGGNYYTNSAGNGYSDTCNDTNNDGFCDDPLNLSDGLFVAYDYLPLSDEYSEEETTFSITLNSPPNQTTTDDSTPDFNFTVSGTESSYSCELFINDTGYGTATANNNTATIITANQSLSDGTYDWYINCTANSVTNQSEVREITIDTNPPTFSNWQQNPPDLNSSSVSKLYINVTITDDSGVNDSSVKFYHWINDSQYPNQPWCFINGTARDFECEHNMTNITSSIFNITLHTYAYNPSTHNVHPETMSSATKYNHSLSSNNKALKVRFYNISTHPNTTYILKSKLYRNSGDLLVYYCNSSYTSGKVYNSDYCVAITTLTSQEDTTYQNTPFYGDENSNIDGVKITSTGYIVFYALTGSDWNVEYANIDSNSAETTNNGGTGWTNQDFTPDVWIIQLNGNGLTTFGYKVYACDILGNCGNSSIQEDTYAIANLPPSPAPEIIVPENSTYSGTFNITWTASKDPNGDPFNYSLYLYYSNGTLADVLADNNITEGTEYFTFDSTQYPDGQYYLISNATDDAGNTNYYIMPYYFTLMNPPILKFKPPTEPNGTTVPRNWTEVNITIDEPNLDTFDFDWDYTELDDYLVGYWRFDNNSAYGEDNTHFYDYSGTGNNGTCSGSYCPIYVEGKKQLGLEFDGVDDYVDCGNDDSLNITDAITIEAWVKPAFAEDPSNPGFVSGKSTTSYFVSIENNKFKSYFQKPSTSQWIISESTTTIQNGQWYHLTATFDKSLDSDNIKVFVNGIHEASDDLTESLNLPKGIYIGRYSSLYFNGLIDEVRIYNRALTAEEIKQRYLSTRARYYDDSLVLALNFNNNSAIGENSTHAVDISKYGNNGTIHGATWTTGKLGKALEFDGVDDYVEVPDSDSLNTKAITVELWYKADSLEDWDVLVSRGRWGVEKPFLLGFGKNLQLYSRVVTTGGGSSAYWGAYGVTNEWIHVAFTYDAVNGMKTYVDAEPKNTAGAAGDVDCSSTKYLTVGSQDNFLNLFNGTIDELRIYNRALSAEEIKMHYLSEFQKYNSTQYRFYNNITDLEEGTYTYYGWANDTAGNEGQSEVREITINTTTITVKLQDPDTENTDDVGIGTSLAGAQYFLIKFNLSSLPSNIEITEALLYLYAFGSDTSKQDFDVYYYGIDNQTWHEEDNVTALWNLRSQRINQTYVTNKWNVSSGSKWDFIDVTNTTKYLFEIKNYDYVSYWIEDPDYNTDTPDTSYPSNSDVYLYGRNVVGYNIRTYTKENTDFRPYLNITYVITGQPDIKTEIWNGTDWILFNDTNLLEFRCEAGQTECEPTNQDAGNSQSIFKITNNGTGDGAKVEMKLNQTFTDITLKCDDDYTYADAVEITSSYQQIHGALSTNSYFYVSCWADYGTNPQPGYFDLSFQIS